MYKCPNCGGEMQFLPENGIIKCEFCGSEFSPEEDLKKTRKSAVEQNDQQGKVYTCSQCGASLYTLEDTGVTFCSYCGSQAFLESRMKGDENLLPDLVIPFRISKEKCEELYKQKIKSAWFLPSKMKTDNTIDKFRGIYMPCWIYSGEAWADGDYSGVKTTRSGSYDIIKTFSVKSQAHGTYEGFVEDAAASFPDGIMREISPFDMKNAKPFNDRYLTGFYADVGNVPSDVYKDRIYSYLDANIKNDIAGSTAVKNHNVSSSSINSGTTVKASITDVKKGYFPVWFLSNKNERTGLMSYAVVNGMNGKIHADLPVDFKKYLLVALLIAIPVFIILQFFTMKPTTLLIFTLLLLGVMMFFSTKMIGDTYIQEHGLDDAGLRYLNRRSSSGGQAENISSDETVTSQSRKSETIKAKGIGSKIARIMLGFICFIFIPVIAQGISVFLDVKLLSWGFILGIVAFVLIVTSAFSGKPTAKSGDFQPGDKVSLPFPVVMRALMFPLIGVLFGIFVLVWNPVRDIFYYLGAVVCCVMLILTVLDFVRSTNRLALRKPAQLGKRGGDE